MIPSKKNIEKLQAKKRNVKPKVHQKISNSFIENAISNSNINALKTIYYLSTILQDEDLEGKDPKSLMTIKIDKREMLKFTESSASGIIKTIDQLQKTNITFLDEENKLHEGMSLLPYYGFLANKNTVEIKLFIRIASLIIDVKRKYTNINVKDLMKLKSPHTLRFLAFLNRISQYDKDIPKRKSLTLDELNLFFGTNYKKWNSIEAKILKPIQDELNNISDLSFIYESNFEALGRGRPKFKDVTIDLINNIKKIGNKRK
jgi:plasmid replication initiation protein